MKFLIALFAASLTFLSFAASAEDKKTGLSGTGEAGFNSSTGNTDEENLYAGLTLNYLQKMYEIKGLIEANSKKENDIQTKERYVGDFQGNLFFADTQKMYGFGQARWENDRFENIDLNSYYLAGLGYKFFNTDKMILLAEAGLGYQKNDYRPRTGNEDFEQGIAKLYALFEYQINDNVRFTQDLNEFYGQKQAKFESNTGLKVKLAANLNLGANYKYRYNTVPAEGKLKEDTETQFTLIYDF